MNALHLYNSYVAASAVAAATDIGLLDAVRDHDKVDVAAFGLEHDLDTLSLRATVDQLVRHSVLDVVDSSLGVVVPGRDFDDIVQNQGYLLWLVRGYGDMLSRVGELASTSDRAAVMALRDGATIARAGKDYGARFVDPIVDDLIAATEYSVLADLGCGSANRIIRLARKNPDRRYVGVEIDAGAVQVARRAVVDAGVEDQVTILHDDVTALTARPEYEQVDALTCFFMGHDFWPRESCLAALANLRARFPRASTLMLSDTYLSPASDEPSSGMFTSGFEYTHAVMGQELPTPEQWVALFDDSTWRLRRRTDLGIPFSEAFELVPA